MAPVATMNVGFSYNQLLSLALQLSDKQKESFCLALSSKKHPIDALRAIHDRNAQLDVDITMDEIVAECKVVRQELYEQRLSK